MTLLEFNDLPLTKKSHETVFRGVALATRSEGTFQKILYYLHAFFVEIAYSDTLEVITVSGISPTELPSTYGQIALAGQ